LRVRRRAFVDEYVEDGESAVMVEDRILVLSPLATATLSAMGSGWVEVPGLAADLGRVFGAPPDGMHVMEATEAVLRGLAHDGVVEIAD
jgi:hypothetical protein